MVFVAGQKTLDDFLSEVAGYLIDTGDWEVADDQVSGGIALRHIPTNNYLAFKKAKADTNRTVSSNYWYQHHSAGILIVLSSQWDSSNHTWAGSYNYVMMGLFEKWSVSSDFAGTYLNNYMGDDDYYEITYWVDKYGIIGVISNPINYNPNNNARTVGCFFAIEYIPVAAREYNDGQSDFFLITRENWQPRSLPDNAGNTCA